MKTTWLGNLGVVLALAAAALPQTHPTPGSKRQTAVPASQQDVDTLRDLVNAQQKQIAEQNQTVQQLQDQLRQVLDALQQSNANVEKVQSGAEQAQTAAAQALQLADQAQRTADQASKSAVDAKAVVADSDQNVSKKVKNLEAGLKKIGPFNFSGDFRLRDEPFIGGPADSSQVRNRERYRLRVNGNAKLNDDISGGFTLATGDLNNPISTNQDANQFFARKAIALDRAFINYNPHGFKPLTLTGGKFSYPWYNTELTWDKDLNPDGLAQTLAFDFNSAPVLKRVAIVGFELPFAEAAGTTTNKSIVASVVYGGQLQTVWQFTHWLKFGAYSGFYDYHNADTIAFGLAKANLKNPQTPASGALALGGNSVQNSIYTTTANGIVTIPGTNPPVTASTGVSTISNAQFASKFGLFDSLARIDIATPKQRWPIALIGDYVQNTEACDNLRNILPAPVATKTATFSQKVNAPCSSRERRGYWGEARFGRAQEKGDWQFAYTRIFIEREAVMGAFNYSELRLPSNVTTHRTEISYQALNNVQLAFTGLFGRPLNWHSSQPPEDFLQRYQFDVLYKF